MLCGQVFEKTNEDYCTNRFYKHTLQKVENLTASNAIKITNDSFHWIPQIQNALSTLQPKNNEKLVLYAENEPLNGILGLFSSLRKEEKGMNTRYTVYRKRIKWKIFATSTY